MAAVWISDAILSWVPGAALLALRLILLILGAVLLTQAATLVTVTYFRHKFMEDVAIGYIVTTIRTLRAAVSQVPAEERAEFVRAASQNQWRLWSRVLPVEARLQRFGGRHPPPPRAAEAAAGQRHARAARAGDMTREEDEERSAARAAERMLDRREGGSPYRSRSMMSAATCADWCSSSMNA